MNISSISSIFLTPTSFYLASCGRGLSTDEAITVSSVKLSNLKADWAVMNVVIKEAEKDQEILAKSVTADSFKAGVLAVEVKVPHGKYKICLSYYSDAAATSLVYESCDDAKSEVHIFDQPKESVSIAICDLNKKQKDTVGESELTIEPELEFAKNGSSGSVPPPASNGSSAGLMSLNGVYRFCYSNPAGGPDAEGMLQEYNINASSSTLTTMTQLHKGQGCANPIAEKRSHTYKITFANVTDNNFTLHTVDAANEKLTSKYIGTWGKTFLNLKKFCSNGSFADQEICTDMNGGNIFTRI